jgi:hypothetical protein
MTDIINKQKKPEDIALSTPPIETNSETQEKLTTFKKMVNNKNKKATASSTAFVINEIKTMKKPSAKMLEMQQAFVESYYSIPPNNANNNKSAPKQEENNANNTESNTNGVGTLGQIAPLFNLLGGGKNAQIGNLISALGDGKMDMNKVISAMAPATGSGGGNLFNVFNPNKPKQANSAPKEQPVNSEGGKSIKDLPKI